MNEEIERTAALISEHWPQEVPKSDSPGLWLKCRGTNCDWEGRFYTNHANHLAELLHKRIELLHRRIG